MKLSVSLPDEEVAFLDEYARAQQIGSRSAVVLKAVRLLRASSLDEAYEEAWREWDELDDAVAWDAVTADGIAGAAR
jgi:Arc/MetJ-type ribon-helix-helix transcriptional regulator